MLKWFPGLLVSCFRNYESEKMIVGYLTRMTKMNRFAGIIVLTSFLIGCSASGLMFRDSSFATQRVATDKSRIIFYRESDANFRSVTLGIDGSATGTLAQRGFIVADTTPGDHKISAWVQYAPIGEFVISITVLAGETYYIRVSQRTERMLYPFAGVLGAALVFADTKGEFQLEPVPASIALVDLEELRLSE